MKKPPLLVGLLLCVCSLIFFAPTHPVAAQTGSGISFDFDTPGQYTNIPANLYWNDWINNAFTTPLVPFESRVGGVGPFPGSGALDLAPNNGSDSTMILLPMTWDFSAAGTTLYASTMVKIKNPSNNNRNTQMGFLVNTNVGINDASGQGFMTVVLQSTAQPAPTFEMRQQRRNAAGGLLETTPAAAKGLVAGNWYRISATFINAKDTGNNNYYVLGSLQDMGPLGTTPGETNFTFRATNSCDIVNATKVHFALRGYENTGVDYRDETYVWTTPGNIFFAQQPASETVVQGRRVAFKAFVDGEGPYRYQWFKNGSPIQGARSWNYIIPSATTADNGATYHVEVTGPANTITSDPATLTVTAEALSLVSVGSVDGSTVGVKFSQPVDKATAENPANYTINGVPAAAARIYRTSAGLLGAEGIYVVLTPASALTGPYTVEVQNVQDLSGNAIAAGATAAGRVENLTGADVNVATSPAGEQYSFAAGQFIIYGGGADIWGGSDGFRYVYTTKTGDFDIIAKVPYMDTVRASSKVGLEVRASLDHASPQVFAGVNPWAMHTGTARNWYEGTVRHAFNASSSSSWGASTLVNYQNAWLRLRRSGNTFLRYSSVDGVNWLFDGLITPSPVLPETVYFGLAVCAGANFVPMTAEIDNLRDFTGYQDAAITIVTQPTSGSVNAGSAFTISGLTATLSGTGVPTGAGELTYLWQRSNGAGGWTNLPVAGVTNNSVSVGTVWATDNGADFRAVITAPGAAPVISDVVTLTVNDSTVPTISSVYNAGTLPGYPSSDIVINFSEPLSASALNAANFVVTNASGTVTIASVSFLNGDPRTVVIKVSGSLGNGMVGVTISNLTDLNNNPVASTTRTFRNFAAPTGPVVMEVFQDIGNATAVSGLSTHALFANSQPTFILYSNLFGYAVGIGAQQDNYGVKAYSYFVPTTTGQYKFWLRSDDQVQLWMNTNGVDVVLPSSGNVAAGERPQYAVDRNPNTKYLNFDKVNTGITMTTVRGTVVNGLRFTTANDAPERDPLTFTLEGTVGDLVEGPWVTIATGNTELADVTARTTAGPAISFANSTTFTAYRLRFPTIRNAGTANSMQIADVEFLDGNGNNVAGGPVLIAENTATSANYIVGTTPANSKTNITLVAGQRYYMEVMFKEGTGNDGFSVTWTAPTVNTAPANTAFITAANLEYPSLVAPKTPVITELYTGYIPASLNNGNIQNLMASTNYSVTTYGPDLVNFKYIAGVPDVVGYQKYFSAQPQLTHSRYDNYLGRIVSYFVPPTNGLYKFYIRSDDSSVLFMNTNAVNSIDPFGKVQLGFLPAFTNSGAWALAGENISLVGGQKYYIEGIFKDGTGGDGMGVAVRAQGDAAIPSLAPVETIPASMLAYPAELCRVGAVNIAGIAPLDNTVKDGSPLLLSAIGISGNAPYGYMWFRNGQSVQNNAYTLYLPQVTSADHGAVYTLVVTNAFSSASASITLNVAQDNTAPALVRAAGFRYNDGFSLLFDEPLDPITATMLGNYQISGGVQILGAVLDPTRKIVSFSTTPQTLGTTYTVTINGVKDASASGNVFSGSATFSTWGVGGNALLVELFTNIPGGGIQDLISSPKFQANLPDITYYTNRFVIGLTNANTGMENYGGRISGYFVPTNTAHYRFYIKADDASQLWMNINSANSEDPAGRVMLIHSPNANTSVNDVRSSSMPVFLNAGQRYYIEGLFKEGGGSDYFQLAFRETDASGVALVGNPPEWESAVSSAFAGVPGNSDLIQVVATPPSSLTVDEFASVNLSVHLNIPESVRPYGSLQWQRWDNQTFAFTNIPGAFQTNLAFVARMEHDLSMFRVLANYPGLNTSWTTTLSVTPDSTAPYIVSAGSLNGTDVTVVWNEAVSPETGVLSLYYMLNFGDFLTVGDGVLLPDQRTAAFTLIPEAPLTSSPWSIGAASVQNQAATPIEADFTEFTGAVIEHLQKADIGSSVIGGGGINPLLPGAAYAVTNHGINVFANGWDIWGNADGFQFTYRQVTGDFDISTRIERFDGADVWSKAGLMARPSLTNNSRFFMVGLTPSVSPIAGQTANNNFMIQSRAVDGGSAVGINPSSAIAAPQYPNAWLRLQRVGAVFNGYISTNGTDWALLESRDTTAFSGGAFAETLYLGLATTGHDQTRGLMNNAYIEYRDLSFPLAPAITSQPTASETTIALGGTVTFSGLVAEGEGTVTYQWRKNGVAIPGATSASLTIASAQAADAGVYTVIVGNKGGGTVSSGLVLNVNNSLPVVVGETNNVSQGTVASINVGDLLANDSDSEGAQLDIVAVSGMYPVTFNANFDNGIPAGVTNFGATTANLTGGVTGSGSLMITAGTGSQTGSAVLEELTPGRRVSAFTASFKLRIFDSSAEPADGMSFNFGPDVPYAATGSTEAERGVGSGFSFAIDNYRFAPYPNGGTANTAGMRIRWGGVDIAYLNIPHFLSPDYIPVAISVSADGRATVSVNGTNAFSDVVLTNYAPTTGRFGFFARTGGSFESHQVDDLSITVLTADTVVGASVGLTNGVVTYDPRGVSCGSDEFFYLVNDGQVGGTTVGRVAVNLAPTNGVLPTIVTCATNRTIAVTDSCEAALPNVAAEVVTSGNCVTVSQSPAAGTLVGVGEHTITITATDYLGNTTQCSAIVTVIDSVVPTVECVADIVTEATSPEGAVVTFSASATDNCSVTVTATPASGSTFAVGTNVVVVSAIDAAGNSNGCSFLVIVQDLTVPVVTCPATVNAEATSPEGAQVTFSATVTDLVDPSPTVIYTPASGSLFPIGETTVNVTAYDASGNTNTCSFVVVVSPATVRPTLNVVVSGNSITLNWSTTAVGYVLEETDALSASPTWVESTATVETAGTVKSATITTSGTAKFYRLRKP